MERQSPEAHMDGAVVSLNLTPKFMWTWPSILVEGISAGALLLVVGLIMLLPWYVRTAAVALFVSYVYEKFYDGNGWSLKDFLQRGGWVLAFIVAIVLVF